MVSHERGTPAKQLVLLQSINCGALTTKKGSDSFLTPPLFYNVYENELLYKTIPGSRHCEGAYPWRDGDRAGEGRERERERARVRERGRHALSRGHAQLGPINSSIKIPHQVKIGCLPMLGAFITARTSRTKGSKRPEGQALVETRQHCLPWGLAKRVLRLAEKTVLLKSRCDLGRSERDRSSGRAGRASCG